MGKAFGVVLCVALLGCSNGSSVADGGADGGGDALIDGATAGGPDYASGTRLRAEVYASTDGARQWHGWFDTQLQTSCEVKNAEDGELRCIPIGAYYESGIFAESGCTQPLATANPTCDGPPTFVVQPAATGCNASVYAIGTNLGALTTVWTNQGGGCQSTTAASDADYYLVGAKSDPATFVKETRTREPRGPDLALQLLAGDDGSKQPNGLFDTKRKGACGTVYLPQPSYADRCVPSHVGYAEQEYSDIACTMPAVNIIPPGTCFYATDDVPTVAWIYESIACHGPGLTRFGEIGSQQTGPLYSLFGAKCTLDNNPPAQWNALGAEILASTFPLLSSSQSGQGRIVQNWQTSPTNDKLTVDGFYDTQLAMICDPLMASDGKLRCVPRALDTTASYLDDQCKTAVYENFTVASCPTPPAPTSLRIQEPSACGSLDIYEQVGAKIATPANLWHWNGPSCETSGPVSSTIDYYALTEVDPTTLAELTDINE